jgi:hypothetical protein
MVSGFQVVRANGSDDAADYGSEEGTYEHCNRSIHPIGAGQGSSEANAKGTKRCDDSSD